MILLNNMFIFREKQTTLTIPLKKIVFFESCGHYVTIHTIDGSTHSVRCTMYSLVNSLDNTTFVRVHSGVIVNLSYVVKIKYKEIILDAIQKTVPLSRSRRINALSAFDEFRKQKDNLK